jgi:hypothetical protein
MKYFPLVFSLKNCSWHAWDDYPASTNTYAIPKLPRMGHLLFFLLHDFWTDLGFRVDAF